MSQQPKFKVGEEVILQSTYEEYNGETVVLEIRPGANYGVTSSGETYPTSGVAYILACGSPNGNGPLSGGWAEQSIKKKHQPGEMNFEQLMNWVRQPITQ